VGIDVDKTMGKGKLIDEILVLNARAIIFSPLLSRIIQKRCHHFASNNAIIPSLQNVLN
jgi:hypothetical protein